MPTMLELLAIEPEQKVSKQLRGKSLVPVMQGAEVFRDVISETNYREYTFKRSIVDRNGWKLIYTLEKRKRELYNLNNDPEEQNDLAKERPEKARELEIKLFKHFESIGHDLRARSWPTGLNPVYPSQAK